MIQGIGTDIIEIERIENAIKRWGNAFLEYVYTPNEIAYAKKHKHPYPHFAGRFAAKEAVYKALGQRDLGWKDIEITNNSDGKPLCQIQSQTQSVIHLSISHSKHYAVASAVATQKS